MHLKPHALGLAGAAVTGLGYLLDAAFHWLAPEKTMKFYSYISFNFDLSSLGLGVLTWPSFLAGLVVWMVMTYVCLYVFGWFYNQWAH